MPSTFIFAKLLKNSPMALTYIYYGKTLNLFQFYLSIEIACLLSLQRVTIFNHGIVNVKMRFEKILLYNHSEKHITKIVSQLN